MKKFLILSCSTGEGHNSAARAVQSVLEKEGHSCTLADPVAFQSKRMEHLVSALYNNTIRKRPQVFGAVYKLGDLYASSKLPSPVYWANAHYSESLKNYILEEKFDTVICSHLYGMEAMTALRKRDHFEIPCYGIVTDYTSIPFMEDIDLTGLFAPTETVKDQMVQKGIRAESIMVSGIPVDESFNTRPDLKKAREVLDISLDRKVFLVMTGGVGCENMQGLCEELMKDRKEQDLFLVLTGNNQKLRDHLDQAYGGEDCFRTIPFTRQVPLYMGAANVVLSKPGGLSSTESAVANLPLVHINAIPGCETCNARYFSDVGMSLWAENNPEAAEMARMLAYNDETAEKMCQAQRDFIHPNAARFIAQKVVGEL